MSDLNAAIRERIRIVPDLDSTAEDVRFKYDIEPIQSALLAVLELHRPCDAERITPDGGSEWGAVCTECGSDTLGSWPCETVLAIAAKLGVETNA